MSFKDLKELMLFIVPSGQSNTFVDPFTTDESKRKKKSDVC